MPIRFFLLCLIAASAAVRAEEPLNRVAAIRALSPEQASRSLPVTVEAVVTFYDERYNLFITDAQDGIFVSYPEAWISIHKPQVGDLVHIDGVTHPGDFLTAIVARNVRLLARKQPIPYRRISAEEMLVPAMECQAVELEAIVKSTSTSRHFSHSLLTLDVQAQGWSLKAVFRRDVPATAAQRDIVEKKVLLRGVAASSFNDQRQLTGRLICLNDMDSISILDQEMETSATRLLRVDELLRIGAPSRQRVRIQGVVTHLATGRGIYLRGEGGSMLVLTAQLPALAVGDRVEAEGYPLMSPFRPSLTAVRVTKLDLPAQMPQPLPLVPSAPRQSVEQDELVTLEAEVVQTETTHTGRVLSCNAGGVNFQATLATLRPSDEQILPEMRLQLTGICEVLSDHPQAITQNASGFRLNLRSANDITILQRPSWWTRKRMLNALGIVALVSLVVITWAFTLNRTVGKQTVQIREQAALHATREERERIARDLHDTLEQELMGVTLVLDDTAAKLDTAPEKVSTQLELARRLLRRAREESRSTIRDLRNISLEMRGLALSMEEMIKPAADAAGVAFTLKVEGQPYGLKGTQEHQIMLIGREAANNAFRHAQASIVEINLKYDHTSFQIVVSDDGIGFDTSKIGPMGDHFGLRGMKERAERCRGTFFIVSTPKQGSTLTVTMPTSPNLTAHSPTPHS